MTAEYLRMWCSACSGFPAHIRLNDSSLLCSLSSCEGSDPPSAESTLAPGLGYRGPTSAMISRHVRVRLFYIMDKKPVARGVSQTYHHAAVQVRGTGRFSVQCDVSYSGVHSDSLFISDGTMLDLSDDGWGICGQHPVQPGMILTLWLHHPDDEDAVIVDEVTVAWVRGQRFGTKSLRTGLSGGHQLLSRF